MYVLEAQGLSERITNFTLETVHCFEDEQTLRIRPITLLVGENSTGKSTVLGCYNALAQFLGTGFLNVSMLNNLDFDVEPYQMGVFSNIVRKIPKKSNEKFVLGIKYANGNHSMSCKCVFTAKEEGAKSSVSKIIYAFHTGESITLNFDGYPPNKSSTASEFSRQTPSKVHVQQDKNNFVVWIMLKDEHWVSSFANLSGLFRDPKDNATKNILKVLDEKEDIVFNMIMLLRAEKIANMAPVRSKPKRNYDPAHAMITSEGDETLISLMQLKRKKDPKWDFLRDGLRKFGADSGMFKDINISPLGKSVSDPSQIQIKIGTHGVNIIDVGYGVSQLLPILVSMIAATKIKKFSRFLVQQPEVHLHPKAQAELASLLVEFAKDGKGLNYLIETHSDYMVDRIAVEIRRGNISPDNVSLVYHESKNGIVKIHNIEFDEQGELVDVPQGYREFFMQEASEFLGLE